MDQSEADAEHCPGQPGTGRRDIKAALAAARRAQKIIAERERRADREARLASDDVMRRREAEAHAGSLGPPKRRPPGSGAQPPRPVA